MALSQLSLSLSATINRTTLQPAKKEAGDPVWVCRSIEWEKKMESQSKRQENCKKDQRSKDTNL